MRLQVNGQWKGLSAGGCGNYKDSYKHNPIYQVNLERPGPLLIELRGSRSEVTHSHIFRLTWFSWTNPALLPVSCRQYSVGFEMVAVSTVGDLGSSTFHKKNSGDYRCDDPIPQFRTISGLGDSKIAVTGTPFTYRRSLFFSVLFWFFFTDVGSVIWRWTTSQQASTTSPPPPSCPNRKDHSSWILPARHRSRSPSSSEDGRRLSRGSMTLDLLHLPVEKSVTCEDEGKNFSLDVFFKAVKHTITRQETSWAIRGCNDVTEAPSSWSMFGTNVFKRGVVVLISASPAAAASSSLASQIPHSKPRWRCTPLNLRRFNSQEQKSESADERWHFLFPHFPDRNHVVVLWSYKRKCVAKKCFKVDVHLFFCLLPNSNILKVFFSFWLWKKNSNFIPGWLSETTVLLTAVCLPWM